MPSALRYTVKQKPGRRALLDAARTGRTGRCSIRGQRWALAIAGNRCDADADARSRTSLVGDAGAEGVHAHARGGDSTAHTEHHGVQLPEPSFDDAKTLSLVHSALAQRWGEPLSLRAPPGTPLAVRIILCCARRSSLAEPPSCGGVCALSPHSGIGLALAGRLLERDPTIELCLTVRGQRKADATRDALLAIAPRAKLSFVFVDLARPHDVLRAAAELRAR